MFDKNEREKKDWDLITVGDNRIAGGDMNRGLTWGEIYAKCFLGDKRVWRYKGAHTKEAALCMYMHIIPNTVWLR